MKLITYLVAVTCSILVLFPTLVLGQDDANEKFLKNLREQFSDYNWVDLDQDLVFIGRVADISLCSLKYENGHNGPWVKHAKYEISPCRWIVGDVEGSNPSVYYASFVYKQQDGTLQRQAIVGEPWLIPGEDLFIIASPFRVRFLGSGPDSTIETAYFVKTIRYLTGDCFDDEQIIDKCVGSAFCPDKVIGNSGIDLAKAVVLRKQPDRTSLGTLISSIMNNNKGEVKDANK